MAPCMSDGLEPAPASHMMMHLGSSLAKLETSLDDLKFSLAKMNAANESWTTTTLAKLATIEALQAWLGIAPSVQTRRQQQ